MILVETKKFHADIEVEIEDFENVDVDEIVARNEIREALESYLSDDYTAIVNSKVHRVQEKGDSQ